MIPEHVVTLAIVLLALWVLCRGGAIIFAVLAIMHFRRGEWDLAAPSCVYACFITLVRAGISWLDWIVSGRRASLHERFRSFPHASHSD